jgi:AcrR family transcriptional regulator
MSKSSPKAAATRDRILAATADLLERPDPQKVLMADIARAADLSRQAVYLHFKTRAELLVATARYIDEREDLRARLRNSREAKTGRDRLVSYIEFWGQYLPRIEGVALAMIHLQHEDDAAAAAWADRMNAMREGCEMAIKALHSDGDLSPVWTVSTATDALFAMLSCESWLQLHHDSGWSAAEYISRMQYQAQQTFIKK